ncbi:MAG: threonine synthase [Oscillospiraceae bacterium]|jgi:threonine synthase|nr:threonine synthase [Oscillospiraceae bacterium]
MQYASTRDSGLSVSAAQAVAQGIAADGGLFLPREIPRFVPGELEELTRLDYIGRAERILSKFFTPEGGWPAAEIRACAEGAYARSFDCPEVAPLKTLNETTSVLELYHGPTCAFKDMALQLLPRLLTASARKCMDEQEIVILVATSGDTGKAALEGFRDVPGTKIIVFYPAEGVSPVQKAQMATQEGANVRVVAVRGNFDDAQTGVKRIFGSAAIQARLAARGQAFSSANSINWGRLAPQIVYYVSAWCDLRKAEKIGPAEPIHFVVPTGNFGNILAGYYAKAMGLPVAKLICASNKNRILTDFLATGVYDRNRAFYTTSSPSMDILISSNLERLLYLASGQNSALVSGWMRELSATGRYEVPAPLLRALQKSFACGSCNEAQTAHAIRGAWQTYGYLSDTHTAVALHVLEEYRRETGDPTKTVVVSTASPYKFAASVLSAVTGRAAPANEFEALGLLEQTTGAPCPPPLRGLDQKPVRFTDICGIDEMPGFLEV